MYKAKSEPSKNYVCAPTFLLKRHNNYIALIADDGNHFLAYGIVEGTTLFVDLEAEYEENILSCFINKQEEFKLYECELEGYKYVGRIITAYKGYDV